MRDASCRTDRFGGAALNGQNTTMETKIVLHATIISAGLLLQDVAMADNAKEADQVAADALQIVESCQAIFTAPPHNVPTKGMPDGPLLGNGDVGVVFAGPPEKQVFYIGKNDFWTRTPEDSKVINVGRVILAIPALQGASYLQEQDLARAEVRGTFTKSGLTVHMRSWVDANTNLLLTELECDGDLPVNVSVRAVSGAVEATNAIYDSATTNWFKRRADNLPGQGREVAVVSRVVGAKDFDFVLRRGMPVTVATAILSDLDAKNFFPVAKTLTDSLTTAKIENLSVKHRQWWADFWSRSFIEIPDKEIEKHWYGALYVMGSCCRPGKVAPGLWGNWLTTGNPNWHGDYHLNYNFQAPFFIVYSANHADLSLPFFKPLVDWMPQARDFARERGWKGIHYPVCIGPWGLQPEDPRGDWGQRSDAAYAAMNFIWYWQYTQDDAWLRQTGYPYLREVAAFWEDYLKLENGRYVIYNDSIHEGSGDDMNPLLSLGLVHTLFKNMIAMSTELGVDSDRHAKWQDILNRLSSFPTQERDGKAVFRYTEKGMAWSDGNTLGIQHIFPAGAIGLGSDPKLLEISHNMIDEMNRWRDYNGFSSWYTACARVGYEPKTILSKLRTECDRHSFPNLLLYYGGGGIENCGGFLAINEMMLQSHEEVLRFFPCWPKDEDARFEKLRATGAFVVSAEMKDSTVTGVKIVSEKGRDCTVQNPWPGKKVRLIRNGKMAEALDGAIFRFKTSAGENITFTEK